MIDRAVRDGFNPDAVHRRLLKTLTRELAFDPCLDLGKWRRTMRAKLRKLIGSIPEAPEPRRLIREYEKQRREFTEIRFVFTSEEGVWVPAHLLLPKRIKEPVPLVICLQGHTSGMNISLGRSRCAEDREWLDGNRDFALQAVRIGFAAMAMEQRCFGERRAIRPSRDVKFSHPCRHAAMVSLLLGRTMIGERVLDIRRVLEHLKAFPQIDCGRIAVMGHSGGGMSAYFAACLDERIAAVMVSGYLCNFEHSIAAIDHCEDNYIPAFLKYFDLEDLAGLIVPRPLLVVAGEKDPIFPIDGVRKAYRRIAAIYKAFNASKRLGLVIGSGGHWFHVKEAWPSFMRLTGWNGSKAGEDS